MTEKLLNENLKHINEKIEKCCYEFGRKPSEITLLAATKTVPPEIVNQAISLGVSCIGENRVQELLHKMDKLNLKNCNLHFIGRLQKNKVKQIVDKVSLIHSVDSLDLAKEISKASVKKNVNSDILIQINIGREKSKGGIYDEALEDLLYNIKELANVKVRGLMAIPPICENEIESEKFFYSMQKLFIDIRDKNIDNINMDYLSMGMSNDYCQAIKFGANIIRIGSAIFGARD